MNPNAQIPVAYLVVFVSLILILLSVPLVGWLKNRRCPRIVTKAVLTDKIAKTQTTSTPIGDGPGMKTETLVTHYVTFTPESGESVTFFVSKRKYDALKKGRSGTLTYQGTHFISFEK